MAYFNIRPSTSQISSHDWMSESEFNDFEYQFFKETWYLDSRFIKKKKKKKNQKHVTTKLYRGRSQAYSMN
jgi:hypothetical protein